MVGEFDNSSLEPVPAIFCNHRNQLNRVARSVFPPTRVCFVGVTGSVTPEQVCEQLKQMVKSSNPSLTKVSW